MMKGLVIWAYSECRSMMGLYREIRKCAPFPVVIATYHHHTFKGFRTARTTTGFSMAEFSDVPIHPVGESWDVGRKILDDNPGFSHLFAVYQGAPNYLRLMREIKKRGEKFGCICESPCNMSRGFRAFLKQHLYLKHLLPRQVKYVVENAEFFFNLSGDNSCAARGIGWPDHKIVPWGYYSPPIPDSHLVKHINDSEFTILVTGAMTWHRAPDVALKAMRLLSRWGVPYKGILTQAGPMLGDLKRMAEERDLPVEFVGLLPMAELIKLYETCTVYVAAGRCEPWGMRLNDALQCGSPLVASRGMGGVKLIDDYGCGAAFDNEDYVGLAYRLKRLSEDRRFYADVAQRAYDAAALISPERKSQELINLLERMF